MKKSILIGLSIAGISGVAGAQTLVYDALSTGATVAYTHLAASATTSDESGDQVLLAQASTLTQANIVIQFNAASGDTNNFIINDQFTIRSVVGTGSTATVSTGAPIYQATFSLGGATGLAAGAWNFTFTLPSVVVPTEFVVSDMFTRVSGSNAGSVGEHFNNTAAAVGFSDPAYFWSNPGGAGWSHFSFGATPSGNMRFSLTGTPVPEPSVVVALGIGAIALIRRRRSRPA